MYLQQWQLLVTTKHIIYQPITKLLFQSIIACGRFHSIQKVHIRSPLQLYLFSLFLFSSIHFNFFVAFSSSVISSSSLSLSPFVQLCIKCPVLPSEENLPSVFSPDSMSVSGAVMKTSRWCHLQTWWEFQRVTEREREVIVFSLPDTRQAEKPSPWVLSLRGEDDNSPF